MTASTNRDVFRFFHHSGKERAEVAVGLRQVLEKGATFAIGRDIADL